MDADARGFNVEAVEQQAEVFLQDEAHRRSTAAAADPGPDYLRDLTDPAMPDLDTLSATGLNLDSLTAAAAQYGERLRESAKRFSETPLPPELKRLTLENRLLRRPPETVARVEELPAPPWPLETRTTLTPPADSASGANSIPEIGEMGLTDSSSGLHGPLGLDPSATAAVPPTMSSLAFSYLPHYNGSLYVLPDVRVQGTVVVQSHGHWYTETWADLKLDLFCNVRQRSLDGGPAVTVVHEHKDHVSSAAYWLTKQYTLYASTKVVAWEPVYIGVFAELDTTGVSGYALAKGDFATGAEHFIRVPDILVILYPI